MVKFSSLKKIQQIKKIYQFKNYALKSFNIIILTILNCCFFSAPKNLVGTELICPDGSKYFIRYVNSLQTRKALNNAYFAKKKEKSKITFTELHYGSFSVHIENKEPELMVRCSLSDIPMSLMYKRYNRRFKLK